MASWKNVYSTKCSSETFLVEAKYIKMLGFSGKSQLGLRFIYKNIEIPYTELEYHFELFEFLGQSTTEEAVLLDRLQTDRSKKPGYEHQRGPTLFLDPNRFSKEDYNLLVECLKKKRIEIQLAFENFVLKKRTFLWLFPTTGQIYYNGIARIVLAPTFLKEIYFGSDDLFLMTNGKLYLRRYNSQFPEKRIHLVGNLQGQNAVFDEESLRQLGYQKSFFERFESSLGKNFSSDYKIK